MEIGGTCRSLIEEWRYCGSLTEENGKCIGIYRSLIEENGGNCGSLIEENGGNCELKSCSMWKLDCRE